MTVWLMMFNIMLDMDSDSQSLLRGPQMVRESLYKLIFSKILFCTWRRTGYEAGQHLFLFFREWFENSLGGGKPVILYLHGNTGSRAREHRIALYHVLQKLDYHIICFDYRGIFFNSYLLSNQTIK